MRFKKIEEVSGSQDYIRLKDKESVVGVFVGDPYEFFSIFENKKPREVPEGTSGAKFRFRLNFVVKDGTNFIPKIFENSATVYRQLDELNAEYDGLDTIYVKITRNGEGLDTTYSILPSKNPPKKEELAHIKTLKLHDLSVKKSDDAYKGSPFELDEEIPF